jgi:hypothetical protein
MWRLELGSSRIQFEQVTQEMVVVVVVMMMMMMGMVVMITIMLRLL